MGGNVTVFMIRIFQYVHHVACQQQQQAAFPRGGSKTRNVFPLLVQQLL
jgi:hypothetical protein